MSTAVVNVRGRDRAKLQADPLFVYVGRPVPRAGWESSFWMNPYQVKAHADPRVAAASGDMAAALAVDLYTEGVRIRLSKDPRIARRLREELRGKRIGCWCCKWDGVGEPSRPCHAVVLARLADTLEVP